MEIVGGGGNEMKQVAYRLTGSEPVQTATSKPICVLALTLTALASGTAGAYKNEGSLLERIQSIRVPIDISGRQARDEITYAYSHAQLLSNIRDAFGLKMSEVAQIFGVSRRAAYDWLAGAVPRPDIVARIYKLNKQADELHAAGIPSVAHFTHRPVLGGRSLLEVLKSGEEIEAAVAIIRRTAAEEAQNRKQLGRRTSASDTAIIDGFDEVSTPISD
jgi:transcriptional regulator with XRE-family HTH domain